ncbi:hypothetical protein RM844_00725 [Streptomyces sp. DSM 44915]|uniref:Uncharacterized protein n=1 Tax=Streptomyces chisholmiae TaxID=3075540 RepID=A0ABU2JIJ0_9ACTN|nr:hypothetical protein [Streptomyces sp. DSM 44915]MDT0264806.1 hypothetical protein [Streptomyces sp. DSM 44915]
MSDLFDGPDRPGGPDRPAPADLRVEIEHRLRRLLADPGTAGATADWAVATMAGDAPELADETVWTALDQLGGADLETGTGRLHGAADFAAWLAEFRAGRPPGPVGPAPPGLPLTLGGRPARYLPAGERVPPTCALASFDAEEDARLADHPRVRRIVLRHRPRWVPTVQCLHWSDGADPRALDELVAEGVATDADFAGALPAQAVDLTCRRCGVPSRVLLAAPGTALLDDEPARLRAHRWVERCPRCAGRWTANVLEILPDAAPPGG